jgi:L-aspartate oxidase
MEFVQFHPTAFYSGSGDTFLISEAVRGEGAFLLDKTGSRFMKDVHELTELAPRDVVSKGIFQVMNEQNVENVFLSLAHLDEEKIKTRFRNIYETSLKYNIDITKDLIPVAPAAHYLIGGIDTGLNGETKLSGLFACGEAAYTGVHGANRLASNSLLECLVFSFRAVESSRMCLNKNQNDNANESQKYLVNESVNIPYLKLKNDFLEIMNRYVGIVRSKESLDEASDLVYNIDKDWEYEKNEYYSDRLKSLKTVALLIINGALKREESRGCHLRTDFPAEEKVPYNIIQSENEGITKKEL